MNEILQKFTNLQQRWNHAKSDINTTHFNRYILRYDHTCIAYAAATASLVTHPIDLLKVRYQLQGELKPPGKYEVKYGTIPQSVWKIFKHENFSGFYKGVVAGFLYQLLSNYLRVKTYQGFVARGMTTDMNEEPAFFHNAAVCALSGSLAAGLLSPLYLAKITVSQGIQCSMLSVLYVVVIYRIRDNHYHALYKGCNV